MLAFVHEGQHLNQFGYIAYGVIWTIGFGFVYAEGSLLAFELWPEGFVRPFLIKRFWPIIPLSVIE